jgi:uncharacterized membrane protein YbaN (DUF454 family)
MPENFIKQFLAHHRTKAAFRMGLGWFFIVFGVLGLFLPFLQGILFLAVGVALLADHIPLFMKIKKLIYHKFPKLEKLVHREHARLRLVRFRRHIRKRQKEIRN